MNKRKIAAALGGLAAAAALTGCGGGAEHAGHGPAPQGPSAQQEHSGQQDHSAQQAAAAPADITFAQGMIPHHQQAVEMSRLAEQRAGAPEVRELAGKIEAAQGPEIDTLTGWLRRWGAPEGGHSQHMGASGHAGMGGMMSPQQLDELAATNGVEFDHRFLELMIAHHEGAVRMAETELARGSAPEAKKMAENIVRTQREEIDTMRALMGR
ncbi:DUF305 domain-containing protein [Saccharopolyspora sp. HNM0986]|uniref:DUF305 domain-containing protein n=1 Tax=Saccharopolyspora galaxeae TaxID=2781241 RepID=UPI00190AEF0D|nr:DUF305 domain-containing protein [Saccharopolyspora sp. HNM0986]MBK0866881.1 DUF305 domain-containing protein [Saccharopolyspora sp. HNM0986]